MTGYEIKLRFNGTPLMGGKIEDLHNLRAGDTKIHLFRIGQAGFIQLEITRDIENDKEKKEEKNEKRENLKRHGIEYR